MKNILIFYTPIIEEIDHYTKIVQSIIVNNKENKIYFADCEGKRHLKNCISNYNAENHKCLICKEKKKKITFLNKKLITLSYNNSNYKNENIEDLKILKYKGVKIGVGIHSAVISILRDHNYNLKENKDLINSIINTSKKTIDFLFDHKNIGFDEVYVFNGRVSHYNSVVEFCKIYKIDFYTFEMGRNRDKHLLVKNALPHSRSSYIEEMSINWDKANKKERNRIGVQFFNKKKLGNVNLIDYTSSQVEGIIPKELKNNASIVSIFGSSRNEYESIDGWENDFLSGDDEKIIREICEKFKDIQFAYRAHPNLKLKKNTQTKNIEKLINIDNLFVFDSYSKISTYELINISDKIMVFASTVGVEATFMKKPVISLGPSIYDMLDISYKPKDLLELKNLLYDNNLQARSREDAIKYGYFQLTRGVQLNKEAINLDLKLNYFQRLRIILSKFKGAPKKFNFNYLISLNDKRIRNQIFNYFFNKNH